MSFWDIEETSIEFDFNEEKKSFIENMDYLFSMSVEEQTLYKYIKITQLISQNTENTDPGLNKYHVHKYIYYINQATL